MEEIQYIDRKLRTVEREKIYGEFLINLFYGRHFLSWLTVILLPLKRLALFSRIYGALQKSRFSQKKIAPFIKKYQIDTAEFLDPVGSFSCFNDFFIRKLRPEARPIAPGKEVAILPADARYLFFPNIDRAEGFHIKGKKFKLEELLCDHALAARYAEGAMVIARLCPVDYHRFHFPCDCIPSAAKPIPGVLYSVNPLALRRRIEILTENKRVITQLQTERFGTVQYIEVGATCVGTIQQTYTPGQSASKGDEKGFFEFGGSCLILLFEPGKIQFDADLLEASQRGLEVRGLLGQSLGKALSR